MKSRILPILLLVAAAPPSRLESAPPAVDSRSGEVTVQPFAGNEVCNFDRVMLDPSGTGLAIWLNDRRSILGTNRLPTIYLVIGRIHDPAESDRDRFLGYLANGQRLLPIRWSPAGRLWVRLHERQQKVVSLDAGGGPATPPIAVDPAWWRVHLVARSQGGIDFLGDPKALAKVRRIDGRSIIRGTATVGRGFDLLGVRHPSLDLVRVETEGTQPVGANSGYTRMLIALPPRTGRSDLSYLGAGIGGQRRYIPYQQPIYELSSGRLAGSFGPTRLLLRRPGALGSSIRQFHERLAETGRVMIDVSASGTALAALTLSRNGDRQVVRLSSRGMNEKLLCAKAPPAALRAGMKSPYPLTTHDKGPPVRLRVFALDRRGQEVQEPGRPIGIHYRISEEGPRDLLIEFHGGPGGTLSDNYFPLTMKHFLVPTRDVLAVEYSGSIGGGLGLSRALAERGLRALEDDVDAVIRWANGRGYRRVFVSGGSFGAIPALVMVTRHRSRIASSFFVAPAVRVPEPENWAPGGTGLAPVATDTQLAYLQAYLGGEAGRRRFASAVDRLLRAAPLGEKDHFYFAERDPLSRPEHLPPQITSPRMILHNTVHAAMDANEEVRKDILSHLNAVASAD